LIQAFCVSIAEYAPRCHDIVAVRRLPTEMVLVGPVSNRQSRMAAAATVVGPVFCLILLCHGVACWKLWPDMNTTAPLPNTPDPNATTPGPREGHSMLIIDDRIILFGGRANEVYFENVPKTYEIKDTNGTLVVSTYDQKPVKEELLLKNCLRDIGNLTVHEAMIRCGRKIKIGTYFNDIWEYNLSEFAFVSVPIRVYCSTDCSRWDDIECQDKRWVQLHPGSRRGGVYHAAWRRNFVQSSTRKIWSSCGV
jgi:hypothetical protein